MARSRAPSGVSGGGAGGQHQAQHAGHRGGGLAARPDALRPGDALDHHGEARVAQVERAAGEQMGGADRREMHADRADGEALIGAADDVHGDGVGIGGERFAAEAVAPGLVLPPGRAVGAAGAVAAGAGGVDRGAAGQLLELGGAGGAVGHGERAEQGGLQDQGSWVPDRPGVGRRRGGRGRLAAAAAGEGRGPGAGAAASGGAVSGRAGGRSAAWRGLRSSWAVMRPD